MICNVCLFPHIQNYCFFKKCKCQNTHDSDNLVNTLIINNKTLTNTEVFQVNFNNTILKFNHENRCFLCGSTGHFQKNCDGMVYTTELSDSELNILKIINNYCGSLHYNRISNENRCKKCGNKGHFFKKCKSVDFADDLSPGDKYYLYLTSKRNFNFNNKIFKMNKTNLDIKILKFLKENKNTADKNVFTMFLKGQKIQ